MKEARAHAWRGAAPLTCCLALLLWSATPACSQREPDGDAGHGGEAPIAQAGSGGFAAASGANDAGAPSQLPWAPGPSCEELAETCGPGKDQSCCASHLVEAGSFVRDNGISGDFRAYVSDFRLDQFEVTVGRFKKFAQGYAGHKPMVGSGRNPNNPHDNGWDERWNESLPQDEAELEANVVRCGDAFITYGSDDDTLPINCITWFEAYAFCIWDGGRLPTDAEMNYAAEGGSEQRVYPWSNPPSDETLDADHAVYEVERPLPVGSKSPLGDGRWGQSDLTGNEWEWCQDWYRPFTSSCINCAELTDYSIRVIRGGSFYSGLGALDTTSRLYHAPTQADFGVGVRCARQP